MARKRLTAMEVSGQSQNDYWRGKALNAIKGTLSDMEQKLYDVAQQITNMEAKELGVEPAQYNAPGAGDGMEEMPVKAPAEEMTVEPDAPAEEEIEEPAEDAGNDEPAPAYDDGDDEEEEMGENTHTASAGEMVFTPRSREAGQPVDEKAIGKDLWREMQLKLPEYTKQKQLTMLEISPTKLNQAALRAITASLDEVAEALEGNEKSKKFALQLDVISDLLEASYEQAAKSTTEEEAAE